MAMHSLFSMLEDRVQKDQISFSAGISGYEKAGHWQLALHLLLRMAAATVVPNEISCSASISACEKRGEWQRALRLLVHMPAARIAQNEVSFSACISTCAKGGECKWPCICCRKCHEQELYRTSSAGVHASTLVRRLVSGNGLCIC